MPAVTISMRRTTPQRLPRMVRGMETAGNRAAYNAARHLQASYKRRVHVITGFLRESCTRTRTGLGEHHVRVGAYYGIYEEYGTRYRPPHPAWRPAIRETRAVFKQEIKKVFR